MKLSHALAALLSPFASAVHPVRPGANEGPFLRAANYVSAVSDTPNEEEGPARSKKWVLLYTSERGHVFEEVNHLPSENTTNEDPHAFVQAGAPIFNWALEWTVSHAENGSTAGDFNIWLNGNQVQHYCVESESDVKGSVKGCHLYETGRISSATRPSARIDARSKDAMIINFAEISDWDHEGRHGEQYGSMKWGDENSKWGWCLSTVPFDEHVLASAKPYVKTGVCYSRIEFLKNGEAYGEIEENGQDYKSDYYY